MKNRIRVIALALVFLMSLFVMPVSVAYADGTVNYDKLNERIGVAQSMKEEDYSEAEWDELCDALEEAEMLTSSEDQSKVDAATEKLEQAIAKLLSVDRTKLLLALEAVKEHSQNQELSSLWYEMIAVIGNAEEQIRSTDQVVVDEAAAQVEDMLEEIAQAEREARPGIIIQEVPVVVPPTDDYCNISIHDLGPILFILSLIANVAMVVVMLIYVVRVLKVRKDDTPLVDYDIDDDLA